MSISHSVRWQSFLPWNDLPPDLVSWLREPHSLTLRCQRAFQSFAVQLVFQGRGLVLDQANQSRQSQIREVVLLTDGAPFIFAHSRISNGSRGRLSCWLRGLGRRSLGSLLFRHPGFQRGKLQFARLDARDALFQAALPYLSVRTKPQFLYARRCEHRLGQQSVWVTEVFVGLAGFA